MQIELLMDKLEGVERRFKELEMLMIDPDVLTDQKRYREVSQEHADIQEIVRVFREYKHNLASLEENQTMLEEEEDAEIKDMCREEIQALKEKQPALEDQLQILLLPKDPNDKRNVILEIRAGTGGEEAALFAGELLRAYLRYAERRRWTVEVMSESPTGLGGLKESIVQINGNEVYSRLKYESGVHRVQRVPATETQGRVHTSAVTVAVLPEAEEVDVEIDNKDLKIDTYRASGAGGQHVNKTDSAIRITHLPSGLVVTCQDEKSQHKNKAKAMKVLRSRLYEQELARAKAAESAMRRSQVGSGDRSEKIRTYNFPQNRISDHRIGLTLYRLEQAMQGGLDEVFDPLLAAMQAEALKQQQSA